MIYSVWEYKQGRQTLIMVYLFSILRWVRTFTYPVSNFTIAKNFNHGYNFWMVGITTLILHMSVHCDKIFPMIPTNLTLWPWPWCLTYLSKTLKLDISFEWYMLGLWYFSWVFLMTTPFHYYLKISLCDLDFNVWPMYWKL